VTGGEENRITEMQSECGFFDFVRDDFQLDSMREGFFQTTPLYHQLSRSPILADSC
jgi:hypothetical protein